MLLTITSTLSLLPLATLALPSSNTATNNQWDGLVKRAPPTPSNNNQKGNTIVQLFEWNWNSVAQECTNVLGPAGYGYAQVSPPSEHVSTQWWTDYQPVSYKIFSKRGTRSDFLSMVQTCHAAGVGVIVDAVLNHMAQSTGTGGTGVDGSAYTPYTYAAVPYTQSDFHTSCVIDYTNANSIWTCQLSGLADLATDTDDVRTKEAAYLTDLQSLGVTGFRLDAAKDIAPADISAILSKLTTQPYVVQEVVFTSGQPVTPNMYTGNGDVHEFRAQDALANAFLNNQGLGPLLGWPGDGWVPSQNAVVFVLNQDSERVAGSAVIWSSPNNAYLLANVFVLGQAYGSPTVFSGFNFSSYDQGAPLNSSNFALDVTCYQNNWRCEQRWTGIANMVGFHNAALGTNMTNLLTSSMNQISFGRGNVGHVAINYASEYWTVTLNTGVPDGSYCEIIHDTDPSYSICRGQAVVVSNGTFTITVPPYDAIAFYKGNPVTTGTPSSSVARSTSGTGRATGTGTAAGGGSVR
ncbi:glycoside hydrolase [Meredithblackwellia eburnea MCA 4105]